MFLIGVVGLENPDVDAVGCVVGMLLDIVLLEDVRMWKEFIGRDRCIQSYFSFFFAKFGPTGNEVEGFVCLSGIYKTRVETCNCLWIKMM